jgi:hypothetical protein
MISFTSKGDWGPTRKWLARIGRGDIFSVLEKYGSLGANMFSNATPTDSGKTANSWTYEIRNKGNRFSIIWKNTNVVDGIPIAIILQYGHGTGTGGYVPGRDYINPVLGPLVDRMLADFDREVKSL